MGEERCITHAHQLLKRLEKLRAAAFGSLGIDDIAPEELGKAFTEPVRPRRRQRFQLARMYFHQRPQRHTDTSFERMAGLVAQRIDVKRDSEADYIGVGVILATQFGPLSAGLSLEAQVKPAKPDGDAHHIAKLFDQLGERARGCFLTRHRHPLLAVGQLAAGNGEHRLAGQALGSVSKTAKQFGFAEIPGRLPDPTWL